MYLKELGIDPETKEHKKTPLTNHENAFMAILLPDHVGASNKLSAHDLTVTYIKEVSSIIDPDPVTIRRYMRDVRYLQNHLLTEHNIPVYSKAGIAGGYWIARDKEEADEFYATFRKRGLTGLVKASRGKQSAMVDMVTQLSFEFDSMVDMTDQESEIPAQRSATPIEIVDAFLKKMTEDPEQYASGLRKIGEKYGNVLIPRKRYEAVITGLKARMAEMQQAVESLSI
jgi:hypothetical protein